MQAHSRTATQERKHTHTHDTKEHLYTHRQLFHNIHSPGVPTPLYTHTVRFMAHKRLPNTNIYTYLLFLTHKRLYTHEGPLQTLYVLPKSQHQYVFSTTKRCLDTLRVFFFRVREPAAVYNSRKLHIFTPAQYIQSFSKQNFLPLSTASLSPLRHPVVMHVFL